MSSAHGTLRRYYLIIEKLKRNAYPSFRELRDHLHDRGFEISDRTLQRDIDQIRIEFAVDLTYHRGRNGYFIEAESMTVADKLLDFARVNHFSSVLTDSLKTSSQNLNFLAFERGRDHMGMEHFTTLLEVTSQSIQVKIVHTAFHRDEPKQYTVLPFLLKEYKKRWYLVGYVAERNDFRSFGLDRIGEIEKTDVSFVRKDYPDPSKFFKDTIGITYSISDVEEVELSFDPFQGKYIKALPLHDSQVVVEDNEKEFRIRLTVRPNFELVHLILGYGDNVTVCKPDSLVKEVKERLSSAVKKYR